jgi:hypothetical protein
MKFSNNFDIAIITVLSWTCATLFTSGVTNIVDKYINIYKHRTFIYFFVSFIFLLLVIYFSTRQKKDEDNSNN